MFHLRASTAACAISGSGRVELEGSCMGGLVDLTNADGQGDRGSVGLNETHRHAGCFGRGARDSREELMRILGPEPLFRDRRDAGRALAARLERYRGWDPLVLGLP